MTVWIQHRNKEFLRGATLLEIAAHELKGPLQRHKFSNFVNQVGTNVADQLSQTLEQRFSALPPHETEAALLAVTDAINAVEITDAMIFAADADPDTLAKQVRATVPDQADKAALSAGACQLYETALDQSCRYLIQVVLQLQPFANHALAEILGRTSNLSDQLTEVLARTPATSLLAPRGSTFDDEFCVEYMRYIARELDRLELLGLPAVSQPHLALSVAYLTLNCTGEERLSRSRRNRLSTPNRLGHIEEPGFIDDLSVESVIGQSNRTLIRGDAGSGKTTLLNWLAVRAARHDFSGTLGDWNGLVPLPIRLRTFNGSDLPRPEEFVQHVAPSISATMPEGWAHRRLSAGTALVLVDGVDEVPASRRRGVKKWLRELVRTFPKSRVVVTSRTAAADHRWLADEEFASFLLNPMGNLEITEFVTRWHAAAASSPNIDDIAATQRRLMSRLEQPHLRELAESPLLCAMLCALNLAHRVELPRSRMDLYAAALRMLLHLRDSERGITTPLDARHKQIILRDLAWRLTLGNKIELSYLEASSHVERKILSMPDVGDENNEILTHLLERSGVLRSPVPDRVDFVHRTFQEYLAADEAVAHDHVDTLVSHAHLDGWWETIVMGCGHANATQAGSLISGILDRADQESRHGRHLRLLAAACLETIGDIDRTIYDRVESDIRKHLVPPKGRREARSLASIGSRVLRYLLDNLDQLSEAVAAATVRVATLVGSSDAIPLLSRYASDPRLPVQSQIGDGWRHFEPERYAHEILAEAPLMDGELTVSSRVHLPFVSLLRKLTQLRVMLTTSGKVEDLDVLAGTPHLTDLMLYGLVPDTIDLSAIAEHTELQRLSAAAMNFRGLKELGELPNLETLMLQQLRGEMDLSFLDYTPNLEHLHVRHPGESAIDRIVRLPKLKSLHLSNYNDNALSMLGELPELEYLGLMFPNEGGDPSINSLRFPRVSGLSLGGFQAPRFDEIAELPLSYIDLHDISDADLSPLRKISTLNIVSLDSGPFDLSPLSEMTLTLRLRKGGTYLGLDKLNPSVTTDYW
ncbi:NACHT domain-containing protein [Nocardioides sp. KC13]|uniref:NACHT domain-containing protein n=2 Tax=Nocardioides turkmenicus TaxID=2711220 RepID=A0A6M1R127_9ACTN|nr:NACHT domain-containing protein [Nocardioides sp. KC13]NGN93412.1 NACHT domain-containing protein [Nocardioides sp. KC13]